MIDMIVRLNYVNNINVFFNTSIIHVRRENDKR